MLCTLSEADQALIKRHLHPVILRRDIVLEQPSEAVSTVYFPTTGVASIIAHGGHGRSIGTGLFGCDGMSGMSVMTGGEAAANEIVMQVAGEGLMIESDRLRDILDQSATAQRHLLLFLHALFVQMSQTVLAKGKANLQERLARWLLMSHDRIDGDRLQLTHQFLAMMLGMRRAGVTVGLHILEDKKLIRANRGEIIILDREGLKEMARDSYGYPEAVYGRLFDSQKMYPGGTRIGRRDDKPPPSDATRG